MQADAPEGRPRAACSWVRGWRNRAGESRSRPKHALRAVATGPGPVVGPFCCRGADQGHTGPVAKAQPFAHALFPETEVPQDALDHLRVVDERNDTHRVSTSRTHQGIRLPNPLDEFAPLGRGDTAGLMLRHIDDLHGLADGQRLLGGPFLTLPAHFVGVPTDVAHQLKALVRDVLGKRNIAPAFRADLIDRYRIAEGSAPVRSTGRRQRHVSS